jgi:hypothetical protein
MNYEAYGWLITITLFALVGLMLYATWFIAIENGYDKGFKSGYKRGQADVKQSVSWRHPSLRERQLSAETDYLMEKVVSLWDRENK